MTDQHPITPPPELVEQWHSNSPLDRGLTLATKSAQWGADQELEACREWLSFHHYPGLAQRLRVVRRPKPPSEADQALAALMAPPKAGARTITVDVEQYDAIVSALLHLRKLESAND